jgi:hypothetical protein
VKIKIRGNSKIFAFFELFPNNNFSTKNKFLAIEEVFPFTILTFVFPTCNIGEMFFFCFIGAYLSISSNEMTKIKVLISFSIFWFIKNGSCSFTSMNKCGVPA